MRIQRSWGLCVLTIMVLVMDVHDANGQAYPQPGAPSAMAGYPGVPPYAPAGAAAPGAGMSFAPQYATAPPMAMGAPGMPPGVPMMAQGGPMPRPVPGGMLPPGVDPLAGGSPMMRDMRVPANAPMMPPNGPHGFMPAAYYDPSQGAPPQQFAPTPAMPMDGSGVEMSDTGGYPMDDYGDYQPCAQCGGYGCAMCACNDFDFKLLSWLLPYGGGGCGMQRWYDASFEWVNFRRDDMGQDLVYSTQGINGVPVLSSGDLDFDNTSGLRASFAMQLGAGNTIETTYVGGFNWNDSVEVTSAADDLFSIYSDYGLDPPPTGYVETDLASLQRLSYSSTLDSIELDYRQRWVSPNVRFQGSWLVGVRYVYMKEDLYYTTYSDLNAAGQETKVSTMNSLTGAQIGGDMWLTVMPGLRIGGEGKIGIYGNHGTVRTDIQTTNDPFFYSENGGEDDAAYVGDLNFIMLWRLNQNWTFRLGYNFLLLGDVALATNNFNPQVSLNGPPAPRPVLFDNGEAVLYHGISLGVEYMW